MAHNFPYGRRAFRNMEDGKPVPAWVQAPINFEEDVWEKVSFH